MPKGLVEEDVLSSSKRSSLQIIADILKIQGTKVAIMYRANLSYAQTQKYLELLLRHGLLESVTDPRGKRRYQATEKGKKLIHLVETIESFAVIPGGANGYGEEAEEARPEERSSGAA